MGRKTPVWTFKLTKKQNHTRENLDMAKKGNPERQSPLFGRFSIIIIIIIIIIIVDYH